MKSICHFVNSSQKDSQNLVVLKVSPLNQDISISHELVRKSNSLLVPDLLNQKILEMDSKINV